MENKINILGVKIDTSTKEALLREIQIYTKNKKKFFIVTPNPEQIMLAQKDEQFKRILNNATFSLADGIGVAAAYKFLNLPKTNSFTTFFQGLLVGASILFYRGWVESDLKIIKGREFFLDVVRLANKKGWNMFLLGGEGKEAKSTKRVLNSSFKNINLFANGGPILTEDGNPKNLEDSKLEKEVIEDINKISPQVLVVGFGAPKQEKWVYHNFKNLKVGGVMVVGGTFKYLSGVYKMPPTFVSNFGLEWLWRLMTGSQKRKRIASAFPGFPWRVFKHKLAQ